jgi:hypothetical protein
MLFGAAIVRAFMGNRGDNARLAVFPALGLDPGHVAQAGLDAVGSDHQPCGECAPVGGFDAGLLLIDVQPDAAADWWIGTPISSALRRRAPTMATFGSMWAKGSPSSMAPPKVRNTGRTGSEVRESVTTMSLIGWASDSIPSQTPSVVTAPFGAGGNCRGALVLAPDLGRGGVDHGDVE